MFLLTVRPGTPPPADPAPSEDRPCVRAQAFLPGPEHDPRVFYLVNGSLHVQDARAAQPGTMQPLSGLDASRTITDLLAVGKDQRKVELLVLIRERSATRHRPWLLTIRGDRVAAARQTGDLPAYHSQEAFFARFHVPRCKRGDRRCVAAVPTSGKAPLIVEQPRRGAPGQPVSGFDSLVRVANAKDVAWVPGDSDALYLAIDCRARAP